MSNHMANPAPEDADHVPDANSSGQTLTARGKVNAMREKALVAWANHKLRSRSKKISDMSRDTANCLAALVEVLTGKSLGNLKENPTLRMHRLANVNRALAVVRVCGEEIGSVLQEGADAIVDGKRSAVLHVLQILVQSFSIQVVRDGEMVGDRGLLQWASVNTQGYEGVNLVDFHESWRSGLAMCALVHRVRPDLISYESRLGQAAESNVDKALSLAHAALDVPMIVTGSDFGDGCSEIDHRSIAIWAAEFWHAAAQGMRLANQGGGGLTPTAPIEAKVTPRGGLADAAADGGGGGIGAGGGGGGKEGGDGDDVESSPHRGRSRGPAAASRGPRAPSNAGVFAPPSNAGVLAPSNAGVFAPELNGSYAHARAVPLTIPSPNAKGRGVLGGIGQGKSRKGVSVLHPDGSLMGVLDSVQAAIDAAVDGCTVSVPDGVYTETLVCCKTVAIVAEARAGVGDAGLAVCVVSVTREPALKVVGAKGVMVEGLVLQQASDEEWENGQGVCEEGEKKGGAESAGKEGRAKGGQGGGGTRAEALLVSGGGELEMVRCKVTSHRGACARAVGRGTVLSMSMCKVWGGVDGGVSFEGGSKGSMRDCDVALNDVYGILVIEASCPSISGTLVHDGLGEGLVFSGDESRGAVVSSQIYNNEGVGLCVAHGADPLVSLCKMHGGRSCGILVQDEGAGSFRDNEVWGHAASEVEIRSGGMPAMQDNKIHSSRGCGVLVDDSGGSLRGNDIYGNASAGVRFMSGADAVFVGNRIYGGEQAGILAESGSAGTFDHNVIQLNSGNGVEIRDGAGLVLRSNAIRSNGQMGVTMYNGAAGTLEANEVSGNGMSGMCVSLNASPLIARNSIFNNRQSGVTFTDGGKGDLIECRVYSNGGPGVIIEGKSAPNVVSNTIYNGRRQGILVRDGGLGTIKGNILLRNALAGIKIKACSCSGPRVIGNTAMSGFSYGIQVTGSGGGELTENKVFGNVDRGFLVLAPHGSVRMQNNRTHKTDEDEDIYHEVMQELGLDLDSASTK